RLGEKRQQEGPRHRGPGKPQHKPQRDEQGDDGQAGERLGCLLTARGDEPGVRTVVGRGGLGDHRMSIGMLWDRVQTGDAGRWRRANEEQFGAGPVGAGTHQYRRREGTSPTRALSLKQWSAPFTTKANRCTIRGDAGTDADHLAAMPLILQRDPRPMGYDSVAEAVFAADDAGDIIDATVETAAWTPIG